MREPQLGQVGVPDVVVPRNGIGIVARGTLDGCGAGLGGGVTITATVEAGTEMPNSRKSCSACARAARASASALSSLALAGSASRRALAFLRVPSPLRIVDSSLAFSAAKRPRSALSSAMS